jgi:predicted metal-dependent hydrolase
MRRYARYKEHARKLVHERLAFYNTFYGYTIGRITIRDQKRRWGSCSSKGNLNFNYKIVFLPPELADYIIIHELCHLKEFNHSPRFWALVEKQCPDYKIKRDRLHKVHLKISRSHLLPKMVDSKLYLWMQNIHTM